MKSITVYGASSSHIDQVFFEAARKVGRLIAESGFALVDGGGDHGLMGAVNDGALEAGGQAIGVIPGFMAEKGWGHKGLTSMVVTDGMHSRKQRMADLASAVIALPGGVGTLDELMEIITWRQLGLFKKPVIILNTDNYYDPLLSMIDRAEQRGFMREGQPARLFNVTDDPAEAVRLATTVSD